VAGAIHRGVRRGDERVVAAESRLFPHHPEAIHNLPDTGVMRGQRLDWNGDSSVLLAEGRFLAFNVDLEHTNDLRSPAHMQVEFGRTNFITRSLLGYSEWNYPKVGR